MWIKLNAFALGSGSGSATVSGEVWLDSNNDGLLDNGESGLSGVTVYLDNAQGKQLLTAVTNASGNYQFNVSQTLLNQNSGSGSSGGFEVQVAIPDNDSASTENVSGPGVDSNVNSNGYSNVFTLAQDGNEYVNAGMVPPDIWQPVQGGDYLWSDPLNWSLDVVPTNGMNAVFDGHYNSQVIVNVATTQGTIILQNGFTAPFEIQGAGAALDIPNYVDNDIGPDDFNVVFLTANDPVVIDGRTNKVVTPGNWNIGAGGLVIDNGDVYNFGIGAGLKQSIGSPIDVQNGQLVFGDGKDSGKYSTFNLTNAAANINIGASGSMTLYQTGDTLIESPTNSGVVISNRGNVTLQGVTGAGWTTISVPLQNHSTFNVYGGDWWFTETDTNNNNISMDAGSINMKGHAEIVVGNQYTQTGGALNIMDDKETFESTAAKSALNFNDGTVNFTSTTGYGTLYTFDVVFNGATLNMRIKANSNDCDLISDAAIGIATIKGNSTINVTLNGTQTNPVDSWTLIDSRNEISGDFKTVKLPIGIGENTPSKYWYCYYAN